MKKRIRHIAMAVLLAGGLALAGCATPAPDAAWRDQVTTAAGQASAGDYAGAQATLVGLEQAVGTARTEGRIEAARADEILAAAVAVRAELAVLASPAPSPEPEPEPTSSAEPTTDGGPDSGPGGGDQGKEKGDDDGPGDGGHGGGPKDDKGDDE